MNDKIAKYIRAEINQDMIKHIEQKRLQKLVQEQRQHVIDSAYDDHVGMDGWDKSDFECLGWGPSHNYSGYAELDKSRHLAPLPSFVLLGKPGQCERRDVIKQRFDWNSLCEDGEYSADVAGGDRHAPPLMPPLLPPLMPPLPQTRRWQ